VGESMPEYVMRYFYQLSYAYGNKIYLQILYDNERFDKKFDKYISTCVRHILNFLYMLFYYNR